MTTAQRRRVAATFAHEGSDEVPFGELYVCDGLVARIAGEGALGRDDAGRVDFATRRAVLEALHLDAIGVYPNLPGGRPMLGVHLAGGGRPEPGTEAAGATPAAVLGLPEPSRLDWRPLDRWADQAPFFTVMVLPGPFGELAYLLGIEHLLVLAWRDPDRVRRLGEAMADYGIELARLARDHGADGLVIGEDVAWDRGLLLRASTYRSVFLPALEREVAALRELAMPLVFHSDGDATALLGDLAGLPLDGVHSLSPAAGIDLARLAPRVDARWCRWGNLDLDVLAAPAGPVLEERVTEAFRAGTGTACYIFGSSAGILDDALDPAAVVAAFEQASRLRDRSGRRDRVAAPAGPGK